MLRVNVVGFPDNCIVNINGYFNMEKERGWFNQPIVKRIIKNIDSTVAVKDEYLESPIFGGMSPDRLSCGCKAVILLAMIDGINVYATKCGDNCAKEILDIAKTKDVTITLHHLMMFPEPFEIYIIESGRVVRNMEEFYYEFYKYRD